MWTRRLAVFTLFAFLASAGASKDAKSVVDDVARTIGTVNLKSIQYSGIGFAFNFGQNFRPLSPWPKFYATYSYAVNYEEDAAREEIVRTQFENPPRGAGGQPLYRESRAINFVSGDRAWTTGPSGNTTTSLDEAENRQLQIAMTPHGWVKAAMTANPTMKATTLNGRKVTEISFTVPGKHEVKEYKVNGYVNDQNLLEKVETWIPDDLLGDTLLEATYSDYRDFGGMKFPMKIVQKQGGFPILDVTLAEVNPNAPVNIEVPQAVRTAAPRPMRVEAKKVTDGLWYLAGPGDNSVAVEFKDYVVVAESSASEARAYANMEVVKKLVPNKPIRYVINSHHHIDHSSGNRAYVAEGVTIITQELNKAFIEQTLRLPHTLVPDALSKNPKPAKVVYVKDKYELTDGTRTLDIYLVRGNGHAVDLIMAYLPKEKFLIVADVFNQFGEPRPNDPPPGIVSPYTASLGENLKRLNLDVEQIAPIHGSEVVPVSVLRKQLEGTVQAPPPAPPKGMTAGR
jgi:glyoxylase-like metal-dependent hydrolase (beta-lactamase superfamily II)